MGTCNDAETEDAELAVEGLVMYQFDRRKKRKRNTGRAKVPLSEKSKRKV